MPLSGLGYTHLVSSWSRAMPWRMQYVETSMMKSTARQRNASLMGRKVNGKKCWGEVVTGGSIRVVSRKLWIEPSLPLFTSFSNTNYYCVENFWGQRALVHRSSRMWRPWPKATATVMENYQLASPSLCVCVKCVFVYSVLSVIQCNEA